MQRIVLDADIHPLSDFRSNFAGFIRQVHQTKRPIVITQHGRSSVVLLDVGEYERMMEKTELIRDIQIGMQQIDDGKGIPHDQVRARLKKRIRK
jgi:prevent-host-death family protein